VLLPSNGRVDRGGSQLWTSHEPIAIVVEVAKLYEDHFVVVTGFDLDILWWRCDVVSSPPATKAQVESRTVLE
jgi:hypothetical protein